MTQRYHANILRLEHHGLMIFGDSGSGKSAVSRALLDRSLWFKRSAILIADDYCDIERVDNKLVARAPDTLRGAMEIRGAGIFSVPYEDMVTLTHVVCLTDKPERYPMGQFFEYEGIELPKISLPSLQQVDTVVLCQAIEAFLFERQWDIIKE